MGRPKNKYNVVDVRNYIMATEIEGSTKSDAFSEHVDPDIGNTKAGVVRLEKSDTYIRVKQELQKIWDNDLDSRVARARNKTVDLYTKAVDKVSKNLDSIDDSDGDALDEAILRVRSITGVSGFGKGGDSGNESPHQNYESEGLII